MALAIISGCPLTTGDTKILFDIIGNEIGLRRSDVETISLTDEVSPNRNGEPTDEQVGRGADQYRDRITQSEASVLVPLGSHAFRAVVGSVGRGLEWLRGYILTPQDCLPVTCRERQVVAEYKTNCKGGRKGDPRYGWVVLTRPPVLPPNSRWIVPTLSPGDIRLDGLKSIPCGKADIARALRLAQGMGSPVVFDYQTERMPSGEAIAFDLETPRGFVELVGASDGQTTWAAHWNACSADKVNKLVRDPGRWKVFHNASFDIPWLEREGIQVPGRIFDTMLAAHLIQPDLYKSLEKSSTLYLDLRPFKHLSTSELARPAADAQVSALMFGEQYRILEKTGQLALFTDTIMPATRVLMGMTKRGLKVDQTRLATWQAELSHKLSGLLGQWYANVGQVNPFSHHQLKRYLFEDMGLPTQYNKYEGVTTDEGAIKALLEKNPDQPNLHLLLQIRETNKLKSTYSEVEIGPDGCVHPSYLPQSKDTDQAGAATGRLASRSPNIQNQPNEARRLFVPHEEGMVLVEADFSQIELRIAASLSGDQRLQAALGESDVFRPIMLALGCDRTRTKNIIYGSLYGAGPRKLASLLKTHGVTTTETECRALQDRLAQAYPQLWGWRTTVGRAAVQERVLVNPFGRRRYFYAGSKDIPAAIDFLPQSCAADILWASLRDAESLAGSFGCSLLTTVHDSILFECPSGRVLQFVLGLRELLEKEFPQIAPGFQVPVKIKTGPNWGEMSEYEERSVVVLPQGR